MRAILMIALVACGRSNAPARLEPPARDAAPVDARHADAATAERPEVIASWSSKPTGDRSPACIVGGSDRFIQYADLAEPNALRFCLWWNLGKDGFPDVGCWRVDLVSGAYKGEAGVWFSTPQPLRVGLGGGAAARSRPAVSLEARWFGDALEVCHDAICKRVAIANHAGKTGDDDEVVFDDQGQLAVAPLGPSSDAKAHGFATLDVSTGTKIATFTVAGQHHDAEVVGFAGPSLMVTNCNDKRTACAWDLYDPRTGARIAAVGGSSPLGAGGTAVAIDAQRFAAVAGSHLVVQDALTGKVTARIDLPRAPKLHADYVVFRHGSGPIDALVMPGPDGRVVFVDPAIGKITRTITPPPCTH